MKLLPFYSVFIILFFTSCADDSQISGCAETVTLQSYEQDGYKLILEYDASANITIEASITSGSANPNDGIILPVTNNILNFSQAGIIPGNYGLHLRTVCSDGGKGEWTSLNSISINGFCNSEATLNSFVQNLMLLRLNITTSEPATSIKLKFVALDDNQDDYIETLYGESPNYYFRLNQQTLQGNFTKTINPGSYNIYLQTICEGNYEGNWDGPFLINVNDYICIEPYNIYTASSGFSGTAYVTWYKYDYAYSTWQYTVVTDGESPDMGIIYTTNNPMVNAGGSTSDLYLRGVCGENTYTDWVQVF